MSFDLNSITKQKVIRPPRMIMLGAPKIGKSTFVAGDPSIDMMGAPSPIFIPVKGEEGIDELEVSKFPVVSNYSELVQALKSLYEGEHDFKTLAIDSTTTLAPLIVEEAKSREGVAEESKLGGGYGHQFDTICSIWRELCNWLEVIRSKGMTIVLIGHVKTENVDDPIIGTTYQRWDWDINKKVRHLITAWADVTLFANRKMVVKEEKTGFGQTKKYGAGQDARYLYTQGRPSHPGGGRGSWGHLAYEIPLSWEALITEYNKVKGE
jgi:hypothetical protein